MKKVYQKIWQLAFPFQDKRNDQGHAKIVMWSAVKLLKTEGAKEDIVLPAAILHDIGWSALSKKERFGIFDRKIRQIKARCLSLRKNHEKMGVILAKKILAEVKYSPGLTREILKIISGHDTRKIPFSAEDIIVKDADKLWRFTRRGFWLDVKRFKEKPAQRYDFLKEEINRKNYFHSLSAKKIARREIEKRKRESLK